MSKHPSQTSEKERDRVRQPHSWESVSHPNPTCSKERWLPLEVPHWIENSTGVATEGQPLKFGLPLPRSRVFGLCHAALSAASAESAVDRLPTVVQCRPLAWWSDGSVRWLLVEMITPPLESGRSNWNICLSPIASATGLGNENEADNSIYQVQLIETRNHSVAVHNKGTTPIEFCPGAGGEGVSAQFQLTDSQGQTHLVQFDSLKTETAGPVCTTLLLTGTLSQALGLQCRLRLTIFTDSELVRLQVTLHNPRRAHHEGGLWDLGDPGSAHFQAWSLKLSFPSNVAQAAESRVAWLIEPESNSPSIDNEILIYQDSSGGENWRSANHMNRSGRVPCQFRGYRVNSGKSKTSGERANPTVAVRQGSLAMAVAVPDFWQQFPLSIQADTAGMEVGLFPDKWSDQFELQGGEQKTHTVWLELTSDLPAGDAPLAQLVQRLSNIAHQPIAAGCAPEWYATNEAMPQLGMSAAEHSHPICQEILQAALIGEQSLTAKREAIDEYGWRNYGDVWADHEQAYFKGEGRVISHYNNQFDMIAGGLRQFMQTGDLAWMKFAAPLARHVIDIDIYRTTQDRAAYNGGLFWFTDHYHSAATSTHRTYSKQNAPQRAGTRDRSDYGGGPGSEHNFATGLLYYYWMTGEPDAAEVVKLLADWVLAMDDGAQNILGLLYDGPTGLASMSNRLEYQGPGRGAANSMQVLLDAWLLTGKREYLSKCEAIMRRVVHPYDDIDKLQLLDAEHRWSYTMFLAALVRYVEITTEIGVENESRDYARESLLAYARWMAANEQPYLDHPEELEFPTEAWAAQELRKANVLRLAAHYAVDSAEAEHLHERGEELATRAWHDLQAFSTHNTARSVAIVMTEGAIDGFLRATFNPTDRATSLAKYDFGQPQVFVPQKHRIRQSCRSPRGILRLVANALRPAAWLRLVRLYKNHRATNVR